MKLPWRLLQRLTNWKKIKGEIEIFFFPSFSSSSDSLSLKWKKSFCCRVPLVACSPNGENPSNPEPSPRDTLILKCEENYDKLLRESASSLTSSAPDNDSVISKVPFIIMIFLFLFLFFRWIWFNLMTTRSSSMLPFILWQGPRLWLTAQSSCEGGSLTTSRGGGFLYCCQQGATTESWKWIYRAAAGCFHERFFGRETDLGDGWTQYSNCVIYPALSSLRCQESAEILKELRAVQGRLTAERLNKHRVNRLPQGHLEIFHESGDAVTIFKIFGLYLFFSSFDQLACTSSLFVLMFPQNQTNLTQHFKTLLLHKEAEFRRTS